MKLRNGMLWLVLVVMMVAAVGCGGSGVSQEELQRARDLAARIDEDLKDVKKIGVTFDPGKKEYEITTTIYSYLNKQQIADIAAQIRDRFMTGIDVKSRKISVTVFAVYDSGEKVGKAFYDARYDRLHQTYLGTD
ncbi:hypothetical protein MFMK1_000392 [Metallumcola ferriviriculae]|uniref:Uncharacterized protein n=1 Tax=Metallumcola ferriviriculae TaxID=3039180 RepID=A0AAU0UKC9_9FIRM|nr:hypothetical protein MFMK1_000392 [Desulfitibacteraceae bacterium MK1]